MGVGKGTWSSRERGWKGGGGGAPGPSHIRTIFFSRFGGSFPIYFNTFLHIWHARNKKLKHFER